MFSDELSVTHSNPACLLTDAANWIWRKRSAQQCHFQAREKRWSPSALSLSSVALTARDWDFESAEYCRFNRFLCLEFEKGVMNHRETTLLVW